MEIQKTASTAIVVRGGKVLLDGEGLVETDLVVGDGQIMEISQGAHHAGANEIDAKGLLVLPGIIDIHGDAFERNIMPRPKTMFPLDMALLETDRQLAANGITTAYHGVTISWEPGLRSPEQSLKVIDALDRVEAETLIDNGLHIRWENHAIDEVEHVLALMGRPSKPLLAFNDHTSSGIAGTRNPSKYQSSAEKAMISVESYLELLEKMGSRSHEVAPATQALASRASSAGVIMLSHDDTSAEMRAQYRELGARIAEFPMNWETAGAAAEAGDFVVLGAPNIVRGGSHNGAISAEEAVRRGQCHILASDYFYPAPLQAAVALVRREVCTWLEAWALVSKNPAVALGLSDRGQITPGMRADLLLLPFKGSRPSLVMSNGRIVYREF
jgi:alpha-D-ribose 1-methylphosphonate 5-triphosphate diphosphatase